LLVLKCILKKFDGELEITMKFVPERPVEAKI
jgi:hypothetical protein